MSIGDMNREGGVSRGLGVSVNINMNGKEGMSTGKGVSVNIDMNGEGVCPEGRAFL